MTRIRLVCVLETTDRNPWKVVRRFVDWVALRFPHFQVEHMEEDLDSAAHYSSLGGET